MLRVDGRQVTGLYIRILTADVGELGNPQRRTVTAQYGYTRGAWTHSASDVRQLHGSHVHVGLGVG